MRGDEPTSYVAGFPGRRVPHMRGDEPVGPDAGTRNTQPADSNALLFLLLRKGAVTGSGIALRLAGFTGEKG